jgi:hypothetical protein
MTVMNARAALRCDTKPKEPTFTTGITEVMSNGCRQTCSDCVWDIKSTYLVYP